MHLTEAKTLLRPNTTEDSTATESTYYNLLRRAYTIILAVLIIGTVIGLAGRIISVSNPLEQDKAYVHMTSVEAINVDHSPGISTEEKSCPHL